MSNIRCVVIYLAVDCGPRLNHFPVTNDINLMLNNVSNRCGVAYCCILIVIIIIDNSFIDWSKFKLFKFAYESMNEFHYGVTTEDVLIQCWMLDGSFLLLASFHCRASQYLLEELELQKKIRENFTSRDVLLVESVRLCFHI